MAQASRQEPSGPTSVERFAVLPEPVNLGDTVAVHVTDQPFDGCVVGGPDGDGD